MDYLVRFIIWSIAVYGNMTIVVHSSLFKPLRDFIMFSEVNKDDMGNVKSVLQRENQFFGKLITCPLCFGFWCGVFWGFLGWSPANTIGVSGLIQESLFNGCVGGAISFVSYALLYPVLKGK